MINQSITKRAALLACGAALGLAVGIGLSGIGHPVPLHATATHGQDNFAIATGFIDEQVEAIYFLDFLTGDLKAAVIQPQLGKYNSFFTYNILQDFPLGETRNPKFLIVTGTADLPRGRANFQFGKSVVYVAEATSGMVACYAIPWNAAAQAARQPQNGTFVRLDMRPFREPLKQP